MNDVSLRDYIEMVLREKEEQNRLLHESAETALLLKAAQDFVSKKAFEKEIAEMCYEMEKFKDFKNKFWGLMILNSVLSSAIGAVVVKVLLHR